MDRNCFNSGWFIISCFFMGEHSFYHVKNDCMRLTMRRIKAKKSYFTLYLYTVIKKRIYLDNKTI